VNYWVGKDEGVSSETSCKQTKREATMQNFKFIGVCLLLSSLFLSAASLPR
jgi:hypothetical protein